MSEELEAITDHVEAAKLLLIEQFKGKPNLENFIDAFTDQVQVIEDMLQDLWTARWLDNATGIQLDNLGAIVGQARNGLSDTNYRIRIKMRIRLNFSSGLDDDIFDVLSLLLGAAPDAHYTEYYPASFITYLDTYQDTSTIEVIASVISEARAAGVNGQLVYLGAAAAASFLFAAGDTITIDGVRGFCSVQGDAWVSKEIENCAWESVCYAPELKRYVAVASSGTNRIAYSDDDGETWTAIAAPQANQWHGVCWAPEIGRFCAVALDGANRVMTSPDGETWSLFSASEANQWQEVCWSPYHLIFCAVSSDGANRVMVSGNGESWTPYAAAEVAEWQSVCWSAYHQRFCAVAATGANATMLSANGAAWTAYPAASLITWEEVCVSPLGRFVAVARTGASRVMYSDDGQTWVGVAVTDSVWRSVIWSAVRSLFVAVGTTGTDGQYLVTTSADATSWTHQLAATTNPNYSVCTNPQTGTLVAVGTTGTNRVQRSPMVEIETGGVLAGIVEA